MPPYCVQADVENKVGGAEPLIQLCDLANTGSGVLNVPVLDAAIESAQSTIDAYINKQVLVPLAVVPATIKHLAARLAAYELRAARKSVDPETHGKVYADDMAMLKMIRDGEITLGVDPAPPKASARIDGSTERPTSKAVSRRKLYGFS